MQKWELTFSIFEPGGGPVALRRQRSMNARLRKRATPDFGHGGPSALLQKREPTFQILDAPGGLERTHHAPFFSDCGNPAATENHRGGIQRGWIQSQQW